ncbi:MAG: 1,6-anhydro-N-acetylmuramyl-L-alanine amidase AmpD [Woeseiaceae bacterium]
MLSSATDQNFVTDAATGLIAPARQCPSPNHDERPSGTVPELIVVHGISLPPGEFGQGFVQQFFRNRLPTNAHAYFAEIEGMTVSSHLFIERDGALTQFVPCSKRAWHAGVSEWQGRDRCNDFSIGIELEGDDDTPYDNRQYHCLNAVIASLREAYPQLANSPVVGHADIAPGRKTDPGPAFDWTRVDARQR